MRSNGSPKNESRLRNLPSVEKLLRTETAQIFLAEIGSARMTELARSAIDVVRTELLRNDSDPSGSSSDLLVKAESALRSLAVIIRSSGIKRVINATGVIIHTNLGRAPLSKNARSALINAASGYCTVEYDLGAGSRGQRGKYAEELVANLTGAESAIIVNNCAAAAFLVLTVFASGGEVVISRGELVEIGGDFRVPDILTQSGAVLKEVGTTNRTKIVDYERAISDKTRLILRVHPSNFRIIGFTSAPRLNELASTAHKHDLMLYEDIGSGALVDLQRYGLGDEPIVRDSLKDGADIVTFSGDKLLGGPQAGIIVGRNELIETIRKHPLYRALRVDKLVYAALESTLAAYVRGTEMDEIPVLRMIAAEGITSRTNSFVSKLVESHGEFPNLHIEIIEGRSVIGGGAAPDVQPKTSLISLSHDRNSAEFIEKKLRTATPPVISRIENDRVLIDLRTVDDDEESELIEIICRVFAENPA